MSNSQIYDVIIVGGGVAGLNTALNLRKDLRVLLLSKRNLELCNTSLAQGGIAGVTDLLHDSYDLHINDTMVAGGYKNNINAVKILVRSAADDIHTLMENGVEFDRNADGKIDMTLEGGHSRRRILHRRDYTGKEIEDKLILAVRARPNVTILENAAMWDIQKLAGGFSLDVLIGEEHCYFNAFCCVFATGGIGKVYRYSTNSAIATGDGIAQASRLGAKIQHLNWIQFHPTAFAGGTGERFLISESVRGEGAYLLNCHYQRFMHRYDNRLELAPRDVVSRAIMMEERLTGSDRFYLDITHEDGDFVKKRFPMIYENVLSQGYDMTKEPIPIYPCQHYLMGGIDVDTEARTTIDGLYAVGECSHTGVHGKNRLASNSLLEAVVFSHRAANDINRRLEVPPSPFEPYEFPVSSAEEKISPEVMEEIRDIMQYSYFVLPDPVRQREGYQRICALRERLAAHEYKADLTMLETRSLAEVAWIVLKEDIV